MRTYSTCRQLLSTLAMVACLSGCGGGGSGTSIAPPVAVTPPPPITPLPPLPPPPSSPPAPVTPPPLVGGVFPGSSIDGPAACASGAFSVAVEADGSRRMTGVNSISNVRLTDNVQAIRYIARDNYGLDQNGFGGPTFAPADKRQAVSPYDYFRRADDEFEILTDWMLGAGYTATLGRVSDPSTLCFYAAGSRRVPPTSIGRNSFSGIADGVSLRGGIARRLFGSAVTGTVDFDRREIEISIALDGYDTPFGDFRSQARHRITVATARLGFNGSTINAGQLTGLDGSTGTIRGALYDRRSGPFNDLAGAGYVFELRYPNGDRIFGAIAGEIILDP